MNGTFGSFFERGPSIGAPVSATYAGTISGDDGSTTSTPTPTPTPPGPAFGMSLDNLTAGSLSSDIGLATTDVAVVKLNFTITPANGFTGTVTVHAAGAGGTALPAGVVIADVPVDITGTTPLSNSSRPSAPSPPAMHFSHPPSRNA